MKLFRSLDKSVFRRRLKDEPGIEQLEGNFCMVRSGPHSGIERRMISGF